MTQTTFQRPQNALSNSPSGICYTGLGCFPLGHHTTPSKINDLIQFLQSLRTRKMLQLIPPAKIDDIKAHLVPLQAAQCFWAHHARDAPQRHAVHELLEMLDKKSIELQIYIFPDSARLTSAAPVIWGLYEFDNHTHTTYIYISAKQPDLAAEYVLADQAERLTEDWELPERLQEDIEMLRRDELQALGERLNNEKGLEAPILLAKLAGLCEELLEKEKEPI
ncbi:hypothetical protein N0V90_004297 [Kalmusia sp. IMI 367209]|nr:hypothetical protein N0V90_004297 [Kalmusia sp. IMI 367209]